MNYVVSLYLVEEQQSFIVFELANVACSSSRL